MCINIKVTLSIVFLLSGCIHVVAQQSFLPQNLGKSVNSELDEFNPVISPDEKNLYFNRSNHPENTYGTFDSEDIWVSEFKNGQWGTAKHLPQLNKQETLMEVLVKSIPVYYEEYGTGIPILMLHGMPGDNTGWIAGVEPLFRNRAGWRRIVRRNGSPGVGTGIVDCPVTQQIVRGQRPSAPDDHSLPRP